DFAVRVRQLGPLAPCTEHQIQASSSPDLRERDGHAALSSNSSSRRIQATTWSSPWPVFRLVNTNGRSPRMRRASRAMTPRSAPTYGARSILLMTSRSDRVTPGPPLRGTLSPPARPRPLAPPRRVDAVDRRIHELGAEARRQVVAAALDEQQLHARKPRRQQIERLEIGRRVLADRRVRAPARLDADDAIRRQRLAANEELHVFLREDVVGHHGNLVPVAHVLAQTVEQRRLAGANGPAD